MNKDTASLVGEATLWHLHHKLLAARLLQTATQRKHTHTVSLALSAALAENLGQGDTLALAPADLVTRYLCGMPLAAIHAHTTSRLHSRSSKAKIAGPRWSLEADADHGVLPGTGISQACFAVGAALASRLHATETITVLVEHVPTTRTNSGAAGDGVAPPDWMDAVSAAVTLQLPLLFIRDANAGLQQPSPDPKKAVTTLRSIPVDRSDALALYRVIYESAARARSGGGPTLIDAHEWRLASSPNTEKGADPVALLEEALRSRKLFDKNRLRHLERDLAREFVRAGWPSPATTERQP